MKYGKFRTKFALIREAVKLFIFGTPAQRQGLLDFYLGTTGGINIQKVDVEYPLEL